MKGFIIKAIGYITLLGVIHLLAAFSAGPKFDPFYMRFTSSKKSSFVFGNSRAARGIVPDELNQSLALQNNPIYNYSFTIGSSPYGPAYFNSIKQKFDSSKTDGIFIFSIDPWSISSNTESPNDISKFSENNTYVGQMKNVSIGGKPNMEYLLKFYPFGWGSIIFPRKNRFLHQDGFLETLDIIDKNEREKKAKLTVKLYKNSYQKKLSISKYRIDYLQQMIHYFKRFGKVFLVRVPICAEMYALEKEFCPNFESIISQIESESQCQYFNYVNSEKGYTLNDGIHLSVQSAKQFSRDLAKDIIELNPTIYTE